MAVDFYELIDMIGENERAFAYFKEHVYKYAGFSCVALIDVRPCDIKEKLSELESSNEFDLVRYFNNSYPVFFFALNKYLLEKKIKCKENSREYAYIQHAIEGIDKSIDDIALDDLKDMLFIVVNAMRQAWRRGLRVLDDFILEDLELRLIKEDYKIIKYTSALSIYIKFEYEEEKEKNNNLLSAMTSIPLMRKTQVYGFYGMVLLTLMLMERGEFEEGSVHHG